MAFIIVPIMMVLSVLWMDSYSIFYKDRILINDFSTLTDSTYQYTDITSVQGKEKEYDSVTMKGYVIVFSDGYEWNSLGDLYRYDEKQQEQLGKLIKSK